MSAILQSRATEKHLLNFSQPQVDAGHPLTLHAGLLSFKVRPHDAHTRREARAEMAFLRHVPDLDLTHYLEAALPSDAVSMLELSRPIEIDGRPAEQTLQLAYHIPSSGLRAVAKHMRARGERIWDVHPKLAGYASAMAEEAAADPFPEGIASLHGGFESAQALLLVHPELINLSGKDGFEIPAYIKEICVARALRNSGALVQTIERLGENWMRTEPAKGPKGEELRDAQGNLVYTRILHPRVAEALSGPLGLAIKLVKTDEKLRGEQWNVQYGVTTATYGARSDDGKTRVQEGLLAAETVRAAGPYKWALSNRTPGSGLVMDPNLAYAPAPQQKEFNTSDIWLNNDAGFELTPAVVQDVLAGRVHVTLYSPARPDGLLRATLKPDGAVEAGKPVTLKADFAALPGVSGASASGTFRLNDLRTALTFSIKAQGLGASPSGAFGSGVKGEGGKILRNFTIVDDSANGNLVMHCTNEWLRHLSACVQYRDAAGRVFAPAGWSEKIPGGLRAIFQQDPQTKFLDLVPPVRTVFGVPLPADPTRLVIPVPPEAQSIQIYFGGLGRGGSYDSAVCPVGVAVTVVAEMAVPLIVCFAGIAITNSQPVVKLMADKEVLFAVCTAAGFLVAGGSATYIGTAQDPTRAIKDIAITLGPMLLSPATSLGQYLMQKFAEGAAARCAPFFNVFTTVVSAAVTAAQLSQTICEVLSSPWVFNAEITRAIDLDITLKADDRHKQFPPQATSYAVSVVYDKGATVPRQVFRLTGAPPYSHPIKVKFNDVPAGGRLKVYVFFYAENGWQAGQGESAWIDAKGTSGSTLVLDGLQVINNEVPLSSSSVYRHVSKIAYNAAKGHHWQASKDPPSATANTPQPFPDHKVQRLLSITTAQRPAMLAYAWQATGLNQPMDDAATPRTNQSMYTLQNISTLQDPETAYATPPVGFNLSSDVFYELTSAEDGSGRNFFLDASRGEFDPQSRPGGGMHLRRVELRYQGRPDFSVRTNKSWGRFPTGIDRYVLHPQGVVLGISYNSHKLWMVRLPAAASADEQAPQATMASGEGLREGLLKGPRGLVVGLDGRVLVLEGGNNRIQAFDLEGKPVRYFKNPKGGENVSILNLRDPDNSVYLDLAVEAKGYLYVLRTRNGSGPDNYQVDLYEPDGTFLVSTPRVTADKITVDLMRNMYTLNYEVILGKDGRTEPSVSMWIPPAPQK
jgi:hypothetical protein